MRSVTFVLFVLLSSLAPVARADGLARDPSAFCPPAPRSIVINGALDEIVWQIPAVVFDFVTSTGLEPKERTQAWVAYGKEGIYFAFFCEQAKVSPANSPNAKEPWKDDSVEVLIDAGGNRKAFDRFVLSAAGSQFQARVFEPARSGGAVKQIPKQLLKPGWQGVAKIDPAGWTAEIYIPYSEIGVTLQEGFVLRANLCRNNTVAKEITCWTGISGNPALPLGFGNLVMGIPLYPIRFSIEGAGELTVGTAKLRVSCDNRSKSDVKLVATVFPGEKAAKLAPATVAAGKVGASVLTLKIGKPGRIDLRLVALDAKTGKQLGESSFGGEVKPAAPANAGKKKPATGRIR